MWIFGIGSLMFDGWETTYGCTDRKWADLPSYKRSFNKKSVESRGTSRAPGLTLNLAQADGEVCRSRSRTASGRRKYNETLKNAKPANRGRLRFNLRMVGQSPPKFSSMKDVIWFRIPCLSIKEQTWWSKQKE
jgi:hypothetical protein